MLFEMLVGYPPFFSDEPSITCQKIMHWRKTLSIPKEANLSTSATDLLKKLITDSATRLGRNGASEIKAHPFFLGVNWDNIRNTTSPNIPEINGETDVSNFDKFEETEPFYPPQPPPGKKKVRKQRTDVNFVGYTYKKESDVQKSNLEAAIEELDRINDSISSANIIPAAPNQPEQKYIPSSEDLY